VRQNGIKILLLAAINPQKKNTITNVASALVFVLIIAGTVVAAELD